MKIIHMDLKSGEVKVKAENMDDLWCLSGLIEPADIVKGETERKIRIGESATENVRVVRKKVYLTLSIEKAELTEGTLRLLGTITDGPEDIGRGEHHTIILEPQSTIKIFKEQWLHYQLAKLKEAAEQKHKDILVIVFDREDAIFGLLKSHGYEHILSMKGDVNKKGLDEKKAGNFYKDIARQIENIVSQKKVNTVIVASPGFWKDYLLQELSPEISAISVAASCSEVSNASISEILKRPELKSVLAKDRSAREETLVESLLKAISEQKAAYGFLEVKEKAEIGAVEWAAISETALKQYREKGIFRDMEGLMHLVEANAGKVHILSGLESMRKIDALGGIGAVLRWKA